MLYVWPRHTYLGQEDYIELKYIKQIIILYQYSKLNYMGANDCFIITLHMNGTNLQILIVWAP